MAIDSVLVGHTIGELHCIMFLLAKAGVEWPCKDKFLVYVQHFNIYGKDGASQFPILKHSIRVNGQFKDNVIPLTQVGAFAHPIPHFKVAADSYSTAHNSFEYSTEFDLHKLDLNSVYTKLIG